MPKLRDPLDPQLSLWHLLSFQLRHLRELHGLTLAQVGVIINAARSTVSNIEAGRLRIDERQAALLDQRYGTGALIQTLLYFACMGHDPEWQRQYADYEARATIIRIYHGQIIPTGFQTEAYIRALLAARVGVNVEAAVTARAKKTAAIFEREVPPYVWLLLDEGALEIEVGGREVMREQLQHLLDMGKRPNVSVRIVPKSSGSHLGQDGPMRAISLKTRDLAYIGARNGGRLVETPGEVRELIIEFDLIGQQAASEEESRRVIRRVMECRYGGAVAEELLQRHD
ncbi:helix-turn-helix transcriptional regulator [Actinocorallia aurantiaca]|uniref:Helix-turn-helix transcriptional regulator n=1 Tax=Actinocorallia aurantiaca TaxID=46204 RepID=A0ABP6HBX5_9ACTN